ncbi:tyrosine-type recombinase/integrase [Virgibacillus oceani]
MNSDLMREFIELFDTMPDNIHRLVFFSQQSKYKVLSNASANKQLNSLCKQLKIREITMHGLRHTKASVMLYRGVSIYYVSEFLGHGDIETTIRDYAHIVKELRREDEEKMLEALV